MLSQKIGWIQGAKAWGIIFIALGHVVGGGIHLADGDTALFLQGAYKYLYSFHVPLFFFLSGITFSVGSEGFRPFLLKKAKRLLVPYFVFGLLSAAVYLVCSGGVFASLSEASKTSYYMQMAAESKWTPFLGLLQGGGWPNGNGFRPNSVLWFLACLFTVEVGYYAYEVAAKVRQKHALALILCLLAGFIPKAHGWDFLPWGLSVAFFQGIFFSAGRLLGSGDWLRSERQACGGLLFFALSVIAIGAYLGLCNPDQGQLGRSFYWYLLYVIASCISISGWCLFSAAVKRPWIDAVGAKTMGIMVLHKFPVVFFQTKVPFIRELFSGSLGAALAGSAIVTAVALAGCIAVTHVIEIYVPWVLGQSGRRRADH